MILSDVGGKGRQEELKMKRKGSLTRDVLGLNSEDAFAHIDCWFVAIVGVYSSRY